jgi:cytoskeletal protein CcmA (bactofilin family)
MLFKKKHTNNMAKNITTEAKPNTIVSGTIIKGEITANGDFRIDGTLIGSINCKGKIVVGQTGTIEGEVQCQNADVSGSINAQVLVEQLLSLKTTASVTGDVVTNKISIEPGAKFTGSCKMDGAGMKNIQTNGSEKDEKSKEKTFK